MQIKEGTYVYEVMKNGSAQQRKIACVFDENRDGKLTGDEVTLFNATSTKENSDGSIDFWTRLSSGKKIKNTLSKEELRGKVLTMDDMKETHTKKLSKNGKFYNVHYKQPVRVVYGSSGDTIEPSKNEGWKLDSIDPKTGEKHYSRSLKDMCSVNKYVKEHYEELQKELEADLKKYGCSDYKEHVTFSIYQESKDMEILGFYIYEDPQYQGHMQFPED